MKSSCACTSQRSRRYVTRGLKASRSLPIHALGPRSGRRACNTCIVDCHCRGRIHLVAQVEAHGVQFRRGHFYVPLDLLQRELPIGAFIPISLARDMVKGKSARPGDLLPVGARRDGDTLHAIMPNARLPTRVTCAAGTECPASRPAGRSAGWLAVLTGGPICRRRCYDPPAARHRAVWRRGPRRSACPPVRPMP